MQSHNFCHYINYLVHIQIIEWVGPELDLEPAYGQWFQEPLTMGRWVRPLTGCGFMGWSWVGLSQHMDSSGMTRPWTVSSFLFSNLFSEFQNNAFKCIQTNDLIEEWITLKPPIQVQFWKTMWSKHIKTLFTKLG